MRAMLTTAVALAVLAVAMVAVCEHTEVCRLRYRVWQVQARHDSLVRQIREIDAQLEQRRTPKRLLAGFDPARDGFREPESTLRPVAPPRPVHITSPSSRRPKDGRRDLRWFEFEGGAR